MNRSNRRMDGVNEFLEYKFCVLHVVFADGQVLSLRSSSDKLPWQRSIAEVRAPCNIVNQLRGAGTFELADLTRLPRWDRWPFDPGLRSGSIEPIGC